MTQQEYRQKWLNSDKHWELLERCARSNQFSKYCFVCDSEDYDVHHENYDRLGKEDLKRDVIALCREHHDQVHNDDDGVRFPFKPSGRQSHLVYRRMILRKRYLTRRLLNPFRTLPTLRRLVYRLLW